MVSMVPNGVCSGTIGHHGNGLYGAQWCLFKHHWAPYKTISMVPNSQAL